MTFVALFLVGVIIQLCLQCYPQSVDHLWNMMDFCRPNFALAKIVGAVNAAIDLTILLLPVPMVWGLQMPRKRKIAVSGIFGMGLLYASRPMTLRISIPTDWFIEAAWSVLFEYPLWATGGTTSHVSLLCFLARVEGRGWEFQPCGSNQIKKKLTDRGPRDTQTDNVVPNLIWTISEPAVGIVCACLPLLRPLFRRPGKNFYRVSEEAPRSDPTTPPMQQRVNHQIRSSTTVSVTAGYPHS